MSTAVDNFKDNSRICPQRLPDLSLTECKACHSRVYFRARSSKPMQDQSFKIEYLVCPVCGASATQVREVEMLPHHTKVRSKVRYLYKS